MDRQQMHEYEAEQRRHEMAAEGREERTMDRPILYRCDLCNIEFDNGEGIRFWCNRQGIATDLCRDCARKTRTPLCPFCREPITLERYL